MTQFAAFPCAQPSPLITAVTLVPAVAPALLEWVSFGCRDILKFRLGKSVPCGRAMKAQVAKAIPPTFVDAVSHLLKWEHRFSFAGQMFLLADLASDTLARWTTLSYQLSGCPDALDGTYWQWQGGGGEALPANVAVPVGGGIINEVGRPGIAFPNGALCPAGWWFSCNFQVTARTLFSGLPLGLAAWLAERDFTVYDFPANKYPPGYPNQDRTAHYTITTQNNNSHGPKHYTCMAMSTELGLTTDFQGTASCTPFPPYKQFLSPLSCLRDFSIEHPENPAGRNPKTKTPTTIDKWLKGLNPTPVRGPPGGKPRSKK